MPRLPRLILALLAAGVALAQSPAAAPPPKTAVPPAKTTAKTAAAPGKTAKPATKPGNPGTKSATAKKRKRGKQAVQQVQLPPPPPTPEQLPPTRPTVSYRNGQLSILANNSTMSDVLNAVRQQTGAAIDTTGVSPSDRVYVKLGPGAPKDILAALLNGSRFNFAILGSDKDPNAVAHVVLMPQSGGMAPAAAVAVNP
ncbi:MAG TPA: hypothetical protein VL382_09670, partial [Terriglobales bacterium]|nr:hypothetical protein [Terriglobales bacterium]